MAMTFRQINSSDISLAGGMLASGDTGANTVMAPSGSTIWHRQGDTFSYAGIVTLSGVVTWGASCALWNQVVFPVTSVPTATIAATLTLIGPNALDATKNDYSILLFASAADTLAWAEVPSPGMTVTFTAAVKFFDSSMPPNEFTTRSFTINLTFDLVPHV